MRGGRAGRTVAAMTTALQHMPVGDRKRLLEGVPVRERRIEAAGIPTAVLEGGDGPPVVLLHEVGAFAPQWLHVMPDLATTNRLVAPDLPGHGASELGEAGLDAGRVVAWLEELIEQTCDEPAA